MSESLREPGPETPAGLPDDERRAINREIWEGGPVYPDADPDETPSDDQDGSGGEP